MARFLGRVRGQRGPAQRLGSAKSGLKTETNGWTCGIEVVAGTGKGDEDRFEVYLTGGSAGGSRIHIATVETGELVWTREVPKNWLGGEE